MIVQYRNHSFEVNTCDLILMGDNFYAKVNIGQRGNDYYHYVKVEPPVAAPIVYTVPENIYPQALWLGISNDILEMSKRKLDIRVQIAASEIARAA
jgi:hypothetical protein